jgi:hypothetical protein
MTQPSDLDAMRLAFGRRLPQTAMLAIFELAWHLMFAREADIVVLQDGAQRRRVFMVPERVLEYLPLPIDVDEYARWLDLKRSSYTLMPHAYWGKPRRAARFLFLTPEQWGMGAPR